MDFRHDGFDIWVFRRTGGHIEYLLLRASPEKAQKWFSGGQFWQIPSDFVGPGTVVDAVKRELGALGLVPTSIWAAEYAYTIYNRRYESVVHLSVFAVEVEDFGVTLGPGHSEYRWVQAEEALGLVSFRGLKDGLQSVRDYVTERDVPLKELRLQ